MDDEHNITRSDEQPPAGEDEQSLDFPVDSDGRKDSFSKLGRRSSSEPADFFEFFNHLDNFTPMAHAEDIFFHGKLIPCSYAAAHHRHRCFLKSFSEHNRTPATDSQPLMTRSDVAVEVARRSSAPRIRRRRRRDSRPVPDVRRSSSRSDGSKPWWLVLTFGPIKFQQEMDIQEMRSRQVRRSPGSMFPAAADCGGNRRDRRSFWSHDFLKVLSCKNHASVAVTASMGLVPHF